jgi:two-component system chemotaxis response regulator CheY
MQHLPYATTLIVDDHPRNRALLRALRDAMGLESDEACDGLDAIDKLATGRIGLVFLDINMPRLDGFGVLEWLRTAPQGLRRPHVVMVTTDDRSETRERCFALGCDGFLTKPFRIEEVRNAAEFGFGERNMRA